jgi:hypothetical protein
VLSSTSPDWILWFGSKVSSAKVSSVQSPSKPSWSIFPSVLKQP